MFKDRFDAAHKLVPLLKHYSHNADALILAIPRGGLQLGAVLAKELHLPLDVVLAKKIGYPGNPEYAIGAASLHHIFLSEEFSDLPTLQPYVEEETKKIRRLLTERMHYYRGTQSPLKLTDKIVIVVDDGVATGNTLIATLELIKQDKPQKIIVALPVAPAETVERLRREVDDLICLETPDPFLSVGQAYQHFEQVSDEEALSLLQEARK